MINYRYEDIRVVHLEITTNCQASCPMCMRNRRGGMPNPNLRLYNMDIVRFKKIFPPSFLLQLDLIYFCGNYGESVITNDFVAIVKYITESNKNIRLMVHTNGSLRSKAWWKDLVNYLPKNHLIYFAIDGLADTHHLYRIGTNFQMILENAKSFISAGGKAAWVFIKFKHNQHQVDAARALAKEHGFIEFDEKETARFISKPEFDVLGKDGNVTHTLEMPDSPTLTFIPDEAVKNYKLVFDEDYEVKCKAIKNKELFVDAEGNVWLCCFLAGLRMAYTPIDEPHHEIRNLQLKQLDSLVERLGGFDAINADKRSIKEVVNDERFQSIWNDEWYVYQNFTCIKTCSKIKTFKISKTFDQLLSKDILNER